MRRLLVGVSLVTLGGLAGRLAGSLGEGERWVAVALHAEPWGWVGAIVIAYLLVVRRQAPLALAVVLATLAGSVGVRRGGGIEATIGDTPAWISGVRQCAGAVDLPREPVRVLLWTIDGRIDEDTVVRTLVGLAPDVAVLSRLPAGGALARAQDAMGGEAVLLPEAGVALYTRGEFPYCREETQWVVGGRDAGVVVTFVTVPDGPTFPLVFARTPAPLASDDWTTEYGGTVASLAGIAAQLGSPATVVVTDGSSTSAYRRLDDGMAVSGVRPAPSPANWPTRIGRLPFPALFPYERAWAGEAWVPRVARLRSDAGTHDPLWIELQPASRLGSYQRPPRERPPGVSVR